MLKLFLRSFIALCAAIAVYVSVDSIKASREKATNQNGSFTKLIKPLDHVQENPVPSIGEIGEMEIAARTELHLSYLRYWLKENPIGLINWAQILESEKQKDIVFTDLLTIWMQVDSQACNTWIINNHTLPFVRHGTIAALKGRVKTSPYQSVKIALSFINYDCT